MSRIFGKTVVLVVEDWQVDKLLELVGQEHRRLEMRSDTHDVSVELHEIVSIANMIRASESWSTR